MEKIKCICGCECNATQKFCNECGAPLSMGMCTPPGVTAPPPENKSVPVNVYPDDTGLKLIIDCCEKVGPLVTGDRYTEIVLYYDEKNESYQVHKYSSEGMGSSTHEGYYTTKELADRAMQAANVDILLKDNSSFVPVCGGSRVIKFRNTLDEMVRVEYHTGEVYSAVAVVKSILYEAVCNENRIVPEYAKGWKKFAAVSTGMSMDNCFSYSIVRDEQGKASVKGNCFIGGVKHELNDFTELTAEESAELEKIPLGLMLSKIVVQNNPYSMNGFVGMMSDGNSSSCTITYSDDKTDSKLPDEKMIHALDVLMKRVFARTR